MLWISRYNGPGNSLDTAAAMAPSPAGNRVFVAGSTTVSQGGVTSWVTVADNAVTGARLWAERYGSPGPGSGPTAVAVGPGGRTVFVTGAITEPDGSESFATVAYRSATGARLWASRYAIPGSTVPASVTVGQGGGRVYVTGTSSGASGGLSDYATVAYDSATGAQLRASRYDGPGQSGGGGPAGVRASASAAFVTGTDFVTIAYCG